MDIYLFYLGNDFLGNGEFLKLLHSFDKMAMR